MCTHLLLFCGFRLSPDFVFYAEATLFAAGTFPNDEAS